MVDLQKVNNKIEELFKSIETMSNPLTQRDHAEMSSVENSLNAAEDFIRFEQKKHNHDEVNTIKYTKNFTFQHILFQSEVHQLIVHLVSILQEISKSGTR